jgi:hypothetical protein
MKKKIEITLAEAQDIKETLESMGMESEKIKQFLNEGFVNKLKVGLLAYAAFKIGSKIIQFKNVPNQKEFISKYSGRTAADDFEIYAKRLSLDAGDNEAKQKVKAHLEKAMAKKEEIMQRERDAI